MQKKDVDKKTLNSSMQQISLLDLKREYLEMETELTAALSKIASNAQYILGPQLDQLEKKICTYLDLYCCYGVASGTDALLIALRAIAIQKSMNEYFTRQDEVITTPFTFTATGGTILRSGATPVFVDIDPRTFNLDPDQVKEAITPKTVGIMPVHLYGQTCQMDEIMAIAEENGLFVVEDVAQAFGAKWRDKMAGSIGDIAGFSFFPSKNLGCFGDGGMISTGNEEVASIAKMLRTHGGKDKYNVEHIGYNSRLDTIQAAILLVKLKHVDKMNALRRKIAAIYNEQLSELDWLVTPVEIENGEHVFHQYTVRIKNGKRDLVQQKLKEQGIATAVYYPVPLHQMKVFNNRCRISGQLTATEKACEEVLSLPIEPLLYDWEIDYIIETMKEMKL